MNSATPASGRGPSRFRHAVRFQHGRHALLQQLREGLLPNIVVPALPQFWCSPVRLPSTAHLPCRGGPSRGTPRGALRSRGRVRCYVFGGHSDTASVKFIWAKSARPRGDCRNSSQGNPRGREMAAVQSPSDAIGGAVKVPPQLSQDHVHLVGQRREVRRHLRLARAGGGQRIPQHS
jgi:hypothetical protein